MNGFGFFSLLFFGFGMFSLGRFVGEMRIIIEDRQNNRFRSNDPTNWWFASAFSIVIALTLAVMASNPAEKVLKNSDQIRSSQTTERALN